MNDENESLPAVAGSLPPCENRELRIISLWEPWSTLMAIGAKRIETRGWYTDYRGLVAIHSTAGGMTHAETFDACAKEPFLGALKDAGVLRAAMSARQVFAAFPRGKIIAVGELVDCVATEARSVCDGEIFEEWKHLDTPDERAFGNYEPGRFGLVFENVIRLSEAMPFKSRQGKLLTVDPETTKAVNAALQGERLRPAAGKDLSQAAEDRATQDESVIREMAAKIRAGE